MRHLVHCLAALALTVPSYADVPAPPRRPPADDRPRCETWTGTIRGNDPDVTALLRLCPAGGDAVTGELRWISATSGTNLRRVEGAWRDGPRTLTLRDTGFSSQRPSSSWRFCPIVRYTLTLAAPDRLEGDYDAPACDDHARITLTRERPDP